MGKHDAAAPLNEALEQHYQEQIKTLNEKLNHQKEFNEKLMGEIENMKFTIDMKDAELETLRKALIDTMVEKTEAKYGSR